MAMDFYRARGIGLRRSFRVEAFSRQRWFEELFMGGAGLRSGAGL
jgi:hypothetical protein